VGIPPWIIGLSQEDRLGIVFIAVGIFFAAIPSRWAFLWTALGYRSTPARDRASRVLRLILGGICVVLGILTLCLS
jgi:threonine/homoserine/homoserine lactone efflux protein